LVSPPPPAYMLAIELVGTDSRWLAQCDETRPRCAKCVAYGVACGFGGDGGELDVCVEGMGRVEFEKTMSLDVVTKRPLPLQSSSCMGSEVGTPWGFVSGNRTMTTMIGDSLRSGASQLDSDLGTAHLSWEFSESHLEILARFQSRTSLTVGGKTATVGLCWVYDSTD
jgi:hypothetical protein